MNLSLYLLFAPASESEHKAEICTTFQSTNKRRPVVVFDPHRPASAGGKPLLQASRHQIAMPVRAHTSVAALAFGASVLANAVGYLLMTGALLMLLRIAQLSLA
jgi:hypothetical protein